jgi:hypothetical protein
VRARASGGSCRREAFAGFAGFLYLRSRALDAGIRLSMTTTDYDLALATRTYASLDASRTLVIDAVCRALTHGGGYEAVRPMLDERGVKREHLDVLRKAAVAAATLGTTAALAESRILWSGFLDRTGVIGVLNRAGFRNAPPNVRLPLESGAPDAVFIDEGAPVPVRSLVTDNVLLAPRKLALALVVSLELARSREPAAIATIQRLLERAVALGSDAAAFDPARLGSLTNTATSIPASGSHNDDVADLLAAISGGVPTKPVIITGLHAARVLAFSSGALFPDVKLVGTGSIAGVPQLPTAAAALAPYVIAVDADGVALADLGIELDVAEAAGLQMDDAPTNATADNSSPPAPIATNIVSLWQTNSIGIKAVRYTNWAARADAIAFLDLSSGSPA